MDVRIGCNQNIASVVKPGHRIVDHNDHNDFAKTKLHRCVQPLTILWSV